MDKRNRSSISLIFDTVFRKKNIHLCFQYYNSGISWSIFIIFVPMETEINTVQYAYLMAWWRHNYIISNWTSQKFTS